MEKTTELVTVHVQDLGNISYKKAWDYQQQLMNDAIAIKRHNWKMEAQEQHLAQKHHFLYCEHPPVYTLGRSGSMEHLLLNETQLREKEIEFYKINRGGDITYHGPGQIVGYPIFDLDFFFTDIHKYIRFLEEGVIRTLAKYGIEGTRIEGLSGVWLMPKDGKPKRKICAIGVHLSRWVTLHGFAFNVNTDLNYFKNIIPCGIVDKDKDVTSMEQELGAPQNMETIKTELLNHYADLFRFKIVKNT